MNQRELYTRLQEMELHETISYPSEDRPTMIITRVIGGWIYEMITNEADVKFTYKPVFVPLTKESKFNVDPNQPPIMFGGSS